VAPKAKAKKAKAEGQAEDPKKKEEAEDLRNAKIEVWTPPRSGRPEIEIDLNIVQEAAAIGCTDEEIAALCGVSVRTIYRRKSDADYQEAYQTGESLGKASLRRVMFIGAMRGNIAAQIFLAKQPRFLGYVDKVDHEVNGGKPINHVFRVEIVPARPSVPPPDPENDEDSADDDDA